VVVNTLDGSRGNVIAPITDSQGMQYNLKANFLVVNNETDTLTLSTTAWYGDARFNNTWFGVNEKQSLHSSFQKYNAKKDLIVSIIALLGSMASAKTGPVMLKQVIRCWKTE
jgi:outer membrane scaffolding protein for murein synthesis (MipA/OmpV family)